MVLASRNQENVLVLQDGQVIIVYLLASMENLEFLVSRLVLREGLKKMAPVIMLLANWTADLVILVVLANILVHLELLVKIARIHAFVRMVGTAIT